MNAESPIRRRWLQFRLRTLLIAVLVLSLPLSWIAVRMEIARKQREVVEKITRLEGTVIYDWEAAWSPTGQTTGPQQPYPAWLRGILGDEFFQRVVEVSFRRQCGIMSGGFSLPLPDEPRITDACLEHLSELRSLGSLDLCETEVTDAGLEHLKGLPNLVDLSLAHTGITDAGLVHLRAVPNLWSLELADTEITDAGLEHLESLASLASLSLDRTQITDAGLAHLGRMTNLEFLTLRCTQVSDAGLEHLDGLANLGYLSLRGTRATDQGIEMLQKALPDCQIDIDN